jgi:Family of unknown function (DUF5309)
MPTYDPGAFTPFDYNTSIKVPIFGIALGSMINRTPLFTRLPQVPLGSTSFKTSTTLFRPWQGVNVGSVAANATSLTVVDASVYQTGDTIEIDTEEYLITAINTGSNVLTVTPGYAGTTSATHADQAVVNLIGNTRTGGEINVTGISRVPTALTNYPQTFQHPYHVGGSLQSATDFALPPGVTSVVGRERMIAIQNCSEDVERAIYYGRPVSLASSTTRPQMAGLRSQIQTNNFVAPTNYAAFKPSDLVKNTTQPILTLGGAPDVYVMSPDWQYAFMLWGMPLVRIPAGATNLGVAIDSFSAPFLNDITIILSPMLRTGTVITLSSMEVRMRVKRNMFDKPRGSTGDADQGDILFEGAVEVDNESHHGFISGITGFTHD